MARRAERPALFWTHDIDEALMSILLSLAGLGIGFLVIVQLFRWIVTK